MEFFYTVENTSDIPHDVGIRIMFDTMLGNNDYAPFRLPAIGDVTTETDLSGDEIPEFWQAFDSLTNPNVIAQGTLKLDKSSTPDRVRFTNWGSAMGNPWDYIRSSGSSNGDSAVCLYWNEKLVGKDDIFSCKTFYGLSALQQDLRPPLAVALSGATKLEVVKSDDGKEEYSPNPFTVTAYIQNIGTGTAKNTQISLNLPLGMEIVNGTNNVNLGDISVGTRQHQVSWKVKVAPSAIEKIEKYSVTVTADNTDPKTLEREISIPKIQKTDIKLLLDRGSIKNGNTLNLKFKIVNEGQEIVDLSQLCTRYYFMDESPKVVKQVHCDSAQFNNPYSELKSNVTTKSIQNITPLRKDANAYIEFGFNALTNKLLPGQEAIISARVNNSTWANMVMINDYSYIGDNTTPSKGYVEWEYMPVYNISNLKNPIWGIEPPINNIKLEPELLVEFKPDAIGGKNYMNLGIRITNRGLKPIDLGELDIKYYYTNDNGYPQSVAGHYIGGRIDNKWPNITNKTNVKVIEMDEPKQLADHYVNITFTKDAGTLAYEDYVELNLQVYNTNWLKGDYILENDHSYQTDNISTFALNQNTMYNTKGMVTANNIVVAEMGLPWKWGKEPKILEGRFASFKVGQGDSKSNTVDDVRAFQTGMINMGLGLVSKYGAKNNIINNNVVFTEDNLQALLEADIAYISTHGFQGGVLPVYRSAKDGLYDYSQIITADKNVEEWDYKKGKIINQSNRFSLNMVDNAYKGWNENLKWLVFAACSQMNTEGIFNGETTAKKWVDVMNNNKMLRGVLGYYKAAPGADDRITDTEIAEEFTKKLKNGTSVTTAWKEANKFQIFRAAVWGYLVKDSCEDETFLDSLSSNSIPSYEKIFLYTKEYKKVTFEGLLTTRRTTDFISENLSNYTESEILGFAQHYLVREGILIDQCTEMDIQTFKKDTYDLNGNLIGRRVEEYIITLTPKDDLSNYSTYSVFKPQNKEITVIINKQGMWVQ